MLHIETLAHVPPGHRFWFLVRDTWRPTVALGIRDDFPSHRGFHHVRTGPDTSYRVHKHTPVVEGIIHPRHALTILMIALEPRSVIHWHHRP